MATRLHYAAAMMKHLFLATLLSFSIGACGKNDVDALGKMRDDACACKDKACADEVNKKMDEYIDKMKEPSSGDAEKLGKIMMEAGLCIAKYTH